MTWLSEDIALFFELKTDGGFADPATYDGGADPIPVHTDRAYLDQLGVVSGTEPAALVIASDVDADPSGKTLVVNGTTYKVRNGEPQDDGAVMLLRLQVAS